MAVMLIGTAAIVGCTRGTLEDRVGRPSGATSPGQGSLPPAPGASTPTTRAGGVPTTTTGTAAPGNAANLGQGEAGSAQLPDGARVQVPGGAVTSPKAQVRIERNGTGDYTVTVDGQVQGPVEVRIPAPATNPPRLSFLLSTSASGTTAESTDRRSDGYVYAQLVPPVTVRSLTCDAAPPASASTGDPAFATAALACLGNAGVIALSSPVTTQLAQALGCGAPWPPTTLLRREDFCLSAPSEPSRTTQPSAPATTAAPSVTAPPSTTPPSPSPPNAAVRPEALQVVLTEEPVICNGARREFGYIANALPGEEVTFAIPTTNRALLPGTADSAGKVYIHWLCDPGDASSSWSLRATGVSSGRTVTFYFHGRAA
jgi:hypothetical protein